MDVSNGFVSGILHKIDERDRENIKQILNKYSISSVPESEAETPICDAEETSPEINLNKEDIPNQMIQNLVTHKRYASVRKVKALTMEQIKADLSEGCGCTESCLTKDDAYLVLRWRKKYHLYPQGFEQQLHLFDIFRQTKLTSMNDQVIGHILEGKRICRVAFYKLLIKVSERTYFRTQRAVKSGVEYLIKKPRKITSGDRGMVAVGFMSCLVQLMGDKSPETERILLPTGLTVKEIYRRYLVTYDADLEKIKERRFYALWKENFPNVTHLQTHSNFSTCNVCLMAKEILENKHPPEVHQATREEWDEHLVRQQGERLSYYERRNKAIENPKTVMSLIIDGMDQAKTNLPHFQGWQSPKACDNSKLLQTHITGVLMHGITTYALLDLQQWPHDANLTMNCLLYTLWQESKDGVLPKTLYIQLDNCARENKNRYFMGLMVLLILNGIVDEIWMCFLMVGHTHEDVDARFSKISVNLKAMAAKTVPELHEVIKTSIMSGIKPVLIPKVFNIRDWILPCLNDIYNHSVPHVYKFYKDRPGHVTIKYKEWTSDEDWKPQSTEEQIELFKLKSDGQYILPQGIPDEVEPDFDRKQSIERVRENIENVKPFLNFNQYEWWQKFFTNPLDVSGYNSDQTWYFDLLKDDRDSNTQIECTQAETSPSPLSIYMNKERCTKQVYTGRKRTPAALVKQGNEKKRQLEPGSGFLVMFQDDQNEIGIGEVSMILEDSLLIKLYHGCHNSQWEVATNGRGKLCETEIKRSWIMEGMIFQLTDKKLLPKKIKDVLKQL